MIAATFGAYKSDERMHVARFFLFEVSSSTWFSRLETQQ